MEIAANGAEGGVALLETITVMLRMTSGLPGAAACWMIARLLRCSIYKCATGGRNYRQIRGRFFCRDSMIPGSEIRTRDAVRAMVDSTPGNSTYPPLQELQIALRGHEDFEHTYCGDWDPGHQPFLISPATRKLVSNYAAAMLVTWMVLLAMSNLPVTLTFLPSYFFASAGSSRKCPVT